MMKNEFHRYFESTDVRKLREQSAVMFKELTSGIYHVEKDRYDEYYTYASFEEVLRSLNSGRKVAVIGKDMFANFKIN